MNPICCDKSFGVIKALKFLHHVGVSTKRSCKWGTKMVAPCLILGCL